VTFNLFDQFSFIRKEVAQEREVEGDIFLADMGQGLFFKPGCFDGAIRFILFL
jgi:hypothetical protein